MVIKVRALLVAVLLPMTIWLAGCGHYTCQAGFGDTTCGSGGSTSLNQGNGSNTASAFVYAVDQGQTGASNGTIDGYELISSSSSFAPISTYTAPTIPAAEGGMGMAVAQKQFLYAGFAGSLEIFGWTISSSGNLTTISGSPFPATFLSGTPSGVGQDTMITDPAGANLFIADTFGSKIYVYQIGSGGVLTTGTGSPLSLPSGFEPVNMTTDGLGKYLYVTNGDTSNHTGTSVAAYAIGTGGALTAVAGSPFAFPMWQVKGEPTGQFLIGTSGKTVPYAGVDDDNLYVFSIGSGTGALTQVAKQSTVYSPFSIAVQSDSGGAQVYSFGFNDTQTAFNPIEGYTISGSGSLSADSGSPFSGIGNGSWGQLDQSGALLFVYGSFLDTSTNQVTTQIAPLAVGSGGALTQPITTLTITTPGFWTVTDAP
jgi:hypothetical protein